MKDKYRYVWLGGYWQAEGKYAYWSGSGWRVFYNDRFLLFRSWQPIQVIA